MTDTVGFIRKLPHHLIKAFKSTLDEVRFADVLVIVSDMSDPEVKEHLKVTESVIDELGAGGKPVIYVYNKCDLCDEKDFSSLADNSVAVDENRILTECAIWADKIAIDEELVRLRSHFGASYDIADADEPSGRKLDFLMQEMNRETNTIGSKANNARIARIVVNVKGELEKIREQVQNIE